jgi:hypothetical protein
VAHVTSSPPKKVEKYSPPIDARVSEDLISRLVKLRAGAPLYHSLDVSLFSCAIRTKQV